MKNISNTFAYLSVIVMAVFLMSGFTGVREAKAECWLDIGPAWMNCDLQDEDNDNDDDDDNDNDSDQLEVSTDSATNIDEDSATLRGEITDLDESEDYDRWFEWGTDDDDLDNTANVSGTTDDEGDFSKTISGLSDDRTYYFRACAESNDSNDEDCGSIRSFTTDEDNDNDNNDDDNDNNSNSDNDGGVITTDATGISTNGAILNGVVINDGGNQTIWFEWGTTTYLGNSTSSRTVSGDQNLVSITVNGLSAGQSYFFRLMSDTGEMGDMKAFMTKSASYVPPTTTPTPTPTTSKPPVTVISSAQYLNVDLIANAKEVQKGDTVLYAVVYENLSNTALSNLTVSVDFPSGVSIVNTDNGMISGQKVHLFLPALGAKAKGDFTIEANISSSSRNEGYLVSVVEGSYEHPSDEDTMISTLDHSILKLLKGGETQAANALFAGGFFPNTFLGWLAIIAIATIIIVLARIAAKKKDDKKNDGDKGMTDTKNNDNFKLKIAK